MNSQRSQNDDILAALVVAVFRLNTAILAAGDALVEPVGQTSARWRVLGPISKQPQTVSEIAHTIGYARQSVQRVSDLLVAEGLARYIDNRADKRAQLLAITAQGAAVLGQIQQQQQRWSARLLQALQPDQLAALTNALDEISQVVEADYRSELSNQKPSDDA